jgi:hypothetical protein
VNRGPFVRGNIGICSHRTQQSFGLPMPANGMLRHLTAVPQFPDLELELLSVCPTLQLASHCTTTPSYCIRV